MDPIPDLTISVFQPPDQDEASALVLSGLADHWGTLDPTKNPDLADIAAAYAGATFLVGRRAGRIVATGALVPRMDGVAEIVRMSVARGLRRQGIGRALLERLIATARASGFRRILLETTETWEEVIAFYLKAGFHVTHHRDGDVYFTLDLSAPS